MPCFRGLLPAIGAAFLSLAASAQTESVMTDHATGTFDVKLAPETIPGKAVDPALGQMSIDKTFHGDLEGTSVGSMLTGGNVATGSAGYVAIEKVSGALKGLKGTFILQHFATMTRSVPALTVAVVPDSGTGQLTGLTGKMNIRIESGQHYYDFDYTLPAAHVSAAP